ncbi:uncharacterized protein EHS24_001030 [Apiotrichum porosum]|uniref:Translocator protein n=1 Tax=Apiotrichum porosum TaxID=105984 RepID=A0A427YBM7_9TREE|nr:uncharacterized protein EHS24_001030 [Apiotrichum porosum]RSH88485.1 hypothetical protein EHS24_001030 [Apiotrichum porosum]
MSPLPEIAFQLLRNPAVAVGLPIALGVASGYVSAELRAKRTGQAASATCPPHPAFGPIWTAMYGLVGYASHLCVCAFDAAVTPQSTEDASNALVLYYAQLAGSLLWTPLYVGERMHKAAFVDMALLTGTAVTMTAKMHELNFSPISTTWFLAPYCAWLGYMTYLNGRVVWKDEPTGPGTKDDDGNSSETPVADSAQAAVSFPAPVRSAARSLGQVESSCARLPDGTASGPVVVYKQQKQQPHNGNPEDRCQDEEK